MNMSIQEIKATREYCDLLQMYLDDGFTVKQAESLAMSDMNLALR